MKFHESMVRSDERSRRHGDYAESAQLDSCGERRRAGRDANHAAPLDRTAHRLLNGEQGAATAVVRRVTRARLCFNGLDRSRNSSEVILAAGNDTSTEARAPRIPIAKMRSLYRLDAVSQRLAKLQQQQEQIGRAHV